MAQEHPDGHPTPDSIEEPEMVPLFNYCLTLRIFGIPAALEKVLFGTWGPPANPSSGHPKSPWSEHCQPLFSAHVSGLRVDK
jgi:hypothetical protein